MSKTTTEKQMAELVSIAQSISQALSDKFQDELLKIKYALNPTATEEDLFMPQLDGIINGLVQFFGCTIAHLHAALLLVTTDGINQYDIDDKFINQITDAIKENFKLAMKQSRKANRH